MSLLDFNIHQMNKYNKSKRFKCKVDVDKNHNEK